MVVQRDKKSYLRSVGRKIEIDPEKRADVKKGREDEREIERQREVCGKG